MQRKTKNFNYDVCVIPNLLNGYIHLYWITLPTFAPNGKYMGRCFIKSKNNGGNIMLSLHIV